MSRTRTIPDDAIHATTRNMLSEGGEKAVSFATIALATGLAASTLAQRYGTRDGMVRAALLDGWDILDRLTDAADAEAPPGTKGVPILLKLLGRGREAEIFLLATSARDEALRERADQWRVKVEAALEHRLSDGAVQKRDSAAMVFSVWLGRLMWSTPGEPSFRLKDAVRRLS